MTRSFPSDIEQRRVMLNGRLNHHVHLVGFIGHKLDDKTIVSVGRWPRAC